MATSGTAIASKTLQTGIKQYNSSFVQNYALFLGGLNATHQSLRQYDPLINGRARIFFVKMPVFMEKLMPEQTKNIRHMLEYGFTKIDGISNTTLETDPITGGYSGRSFDVATMSKDETNSITITVYEFSGSPVREYLDMWISGIMDHNTGLGHYHGLLDADPTIKWAQYNHVAEAIFVATDPTGRADGIEYACLLTNMMPKEVKKDHFNYESGQSNIVQVDINFTAVKYESPQINELAKSLLTRFQTMKNSLEFKSEYTPEQMSQHYKPRINNWPDEYNVGASD